MILDYQFKNEKELGVFLDKHLSTCMSAYLFKFQHSRVQTSEIILNKIHKAYGTIELSKLKNIVKWNK